MDFNINMQAMNQAITVLGTVSEEITAGQKTAYNAVSSLCEEGWDGESQVAFLNHFMKWYTQAQKISDRASEMKKILSTNITKTDALLHKGQALKFK